MVLVTVAVVLAVIGASLVVYACVFGSTPPKKRTSMKTDLMVAVKKKFDSIGKKIVIDKVEAAQQAHRNGGVHPLLLNQCIFLSGGLRNAFRGLADNNLTITLVRGAWTSRVPPANAYNFKWDPTLGGYDHDWLAIGEGPCDRDNYETWIEAALWFDPAYYQFVDQLASTWDYETCFTCRPHLYFDSKRTGLQNGWITDKYDPYR